MRLLNTTSVGDRFRVAHPDQSSLNGLPMHRSELFRVDKVYGSLPFVRICSLVQSEDRRIRSLMPEVPILSERERDPSIEEVEKFLLGPIPKTKVVGYELSWDGESQIDHLLQPQERTVFTQLWLRGRRRLSVEEMRESLSTIRLSGKVSAARAFQFYAPHLAELGLLRETREQRNSVSRKLHEIVGAKDRR